MGWSPGLDKKEKVSWALAVIILGLLTAAAASLGVLCSCHHAAPAMMVANNPPPHSISHDKVSRM